MKKLTIYDKCLKENTFLSTFCKQCSNTNTPTIFDFWQGMYCLSSILNRKVVIEIDDKFYFPNIYCLFVSDNSEFLENAQKVLESVEFSVLCDENHEFINSYTAPNSLIEMLAKRSDKKELNNIRIAVSSMDTFFKSKDSVKLITDLYSCPTTRRGYNGKSKYEFNNVGSIIYSFVWNDFCDNYIEMAKFSSDTDATKSTLYYVLIGIIKMLHPFMPYVTEEIYQNLPFKDNDSIMISTYPKYDLNLVFEQDAKVIDNLIGFVANYRNVKQENNIDKNFKVKINNDSDYTLIKKMLKLDGLS